jgi:hypothetical protein
MRRRLQAHRTVRVYLLGDPAAAHELLFALEGVTNIRPAADNGQIRPDQLLFDFVGDDEGLSAVLVALVQGGLGVVSFAELPNDLEDVFLQVTRGIVS